MNQLDFEAWVLQTRELDTSSRPQVMQRGLNLGYSRDFCKNAWDKAGRTLARRLQEEDLECGGVE
jgi:hypothetical protein